MIALTVKLCQFSIELIKHMNKDFFQGRQGLAVKYMLSVFGYKNQMNMHVKNAMPAGSDIGIFLHNALTIT